MKTMKGWSVPADGKPHPVKALPNLRGQFVTARHPGFVEFWCETSGEDYPLFRYQVFPEGEQIPLGADYIGSVLSPKLPYPFDGSDQRVLHLFCLGEVTET